MIRHITGPRPGPAGPGALGPSPAGPAGRPFKSWTRKFVIPFLCSALAVYIPQNIPSPLDLATRRRCPLPLLQIGPPPARRRAGPGPGRPRSSRPRARLLRARVPDTRALTIGLIIVALYTCDRTSTRHSSRGAVPPAGCLSPGRVYSMVVGKKLRCNYVEYMVLLLMVFEVYRPYVFSRTVQGPSRPSKPSKDRLQVIDTSFPQVWKIGICS
jgi:hypothetical protein